MLQIWLENVIVKTDFVAKLNRSTVWPDNYGITWSQLANAHDTHNSNI